MQTGGEIREIVVEQDNQFLNSITFFARLLDGSESRPTHNASISRQGILVQQIQDQNKQIKRKAPL